MLSGYGVLSVVLFRFSWGFYGSSPSLFSSFLRGPILVWNYSKTIFKRNSKRYFSHNPLGGWSVLLMLTALLVQAVSGLFANDDLFNEGPLYKHVSMYWSDIFTNIHQFVAYVLISIILLHVVAIFFYRVWKNQYLIRPMVTGYTEESSSNCKYTPVKRWRVLFLVMLSGGLVALIVNL